jgi:hypothetical protein
MNNTPRLSAFCLALLGTGPVIAGGLSGKEVYQLNRRSVLKVNVTCTLFDGSIEKRNGTGFLISKEGHVITSYHLIGDPEDCEKLDVDGSVRNVGDPWRYDSALRVLPVDSKYDVSLLQVLQPIDSEPVALRQVEQPGVLEEFIFLTYSLSPELAGTASSIRAKQLASIWQTNHSFNPGDSGAPILDLEGRAIGLVMGRVAHANLGAGPVDVEDIGWMVATVPAINELLAGIPAKRRFLVANNVAQPSYAVNSIDISLEPGVEQVTQICPPLRPCLPVDPEGSIIPKVLTRFIAAPPNSVISRYSFNGRINKGSVTMDIAPDDKAAQLNARVSAKSDAILKGVVKVFYDSLLIQMAYPIKLATKDADAPGVVKRLEAEPDYRFTKAEFRSQQQSRADDAQVRIAEDGRTLLFTAKVGTDGEGPGVVRGFIVTTQERTRD